MGLPAVAVIVDGCRSGGLFPSAFKEKGIQCVNIQSCNPIPPVFREGFRPESFIENIIFQKDAAALAKSLIEKYEVLCVIPGAEIGVEVSDQISEALSVLSNGTARSRARRDKYEMALALQEAGLPTPKFCKLSSWDELVRWKTQEQVDYPIVLKPLNSCGTDGVFICQNETELYTALHQLVGSTNLLSEINCQILAQSFLAGEEYLINSVSRDGQLFVTAILHGKKKRIEGHGDIYVHEKILKSTGPIQDALVAMHRKVAAALEIQHGPLHAEYKFTEQGPVLIEIAARVSGGTHPTNAESTGFEQVKLVVDAYTDPTKFKAQTINPYLRSKYFYEMFLNAPNDGTITGKAAFESAIKRLESYRDHSFKLNDGDYVPKTLDLVSSICTVFLVHEDKCKIQSDYVKITQLANKLIAPLSIRAA